MYSVGGMGKGVWEQGTRGENRGSEAKKFGKTRFNKVNRHVFVAGVLQALNRIMCIELPRPWRRNLVVFDHTILFH